jgi:hypothetical protein
MAKRMKEVRARRAPSDVLIIAVDPLRTARGHRTLPRGGTHESAKHPKRARSKRAWARQLAERSAGCREGAA